MSNHPRARSLSVLLPAEVRFFLFLEVGEGWRKISVALLVNVLHYREEEKLDIVESRASVIGCRSMRRWQRSLLCAE
jgi:hypothetical protein